MSALANLGRAAVTAWTAALIGSAGVSAAQGGQGGFGGGFGGGANPEGLGDRVTGRSILTPGQYGEWPITATAGETIIVHVSSTTFDPAVELVDSANKVIAQNDDVRTGEQESQLLYTFAKAGKYRVLVKAFKGAGGGQYEFSMRRFTALAADIGKRVAGTMDPTHSKWFRVHAERGKTLIVAARSATYRPGVEVYSPIGELVSAESSDAERSRRAVYQAPATGDYYIRLGGQAGDGGNSYAVTVAFAREFAAVVGQPSVSQRLDAGGMDVWKLTGKAGDLIRIRAMADGGMVYAIPDFDLPEPGRPEATLAEDKSSPLVEIEGNPKSPGELVVLLNRAGTFRISVSQPMGLPASYAFSSATTGRAWKAGESPEGTLPLGESDYWFVQGTAGSILQLGASSTAFDTTIDILNPQGSAIGRNDDGGGKRDSLLTQLLNKTGRYLVRVHAHGDGGSGSYRLQWLPNPVRALALGTPAPGSLGPGAAAIWSFTGRKDQTVILSARSSEFDTMVRIYGPDGLDIAAVDGGGDGTDSLAAVHLPLDGTYTVWVTARSGGGAYSLRILDADK